MTKEKFLKELDNHILLHPHLGLHVVPMTVVEELLEELDLEVDINPKEQVEKLTTKLSELQQTLSTLKDI